MIALMTTLNLTVQNEVLPAWDRFFDDSLRRNDMKKLVAIIVVVLVAGCAATGGQGTASVGTGQQDMSYRSGR